MCCIGSRDRPTVEKDHEFHCGLGQLPALVPQHKELIAAGRISGRSIFAEEGQQERMVTLITSVPFH